MSIHITPEMLSIMRSLAERVDAARADFDTATQRLTAAGEQLDAYIRQCAILLGLPEDTPFDKPRAVFVENRHAVESHD